MIWVHAITIIILQQPGKEFDTKLKEGDKIIRKARIAFAPDPNRIRNKPVSTHPLPHFKYIFYHKQCHCRD